MGASQSLQSSIQILIILWLVYPIHTNSLFKVIFRELPFCRFPPLNTYTLGKDSRIQLIFDLNILVFQTNGKQPYSFPVLSRFCNCLFLTFATTSITLVFGVILPRDHIQGITELLCIIQYFLWWDGPRSAKQWKTKEHIRLVLHAVVGQALTYLQLLCGVNHTKLILWYALQKIP